MPGEPGEFGFECMLHIALTICLVLALQPKLSMTQTLVGHASKGKGKSMSKDEQGQMQEAWPFWQLVQLMESRCIGDPLVLAALNVRATSRCRCLCSSEPHFGREKFRGLVSLHRQL